MSYLRAVLKKDNETKINELKKLIDLGEKLKKDTTPDKKKLEILLRRESNSSSTSKVTKENNNRQSSSSSSSNIKYAIDKVYTNGNKIIVEFNVDIAKNDVKFFELKQSSVTKDVYDIPGYFKDAIPTKLSIDGVQNIVIGQFKPDVLRIVLSDKQNLDTSFSLANSRQLVITVDGLNNFTSNNKSKEVDEPKIENTKQDDSSNNYIDNKNPIRSITSRDNKIIVQFNKDYSKNDISYKNYKYGKSFEDVFDIRGKFEHTGPTVLKIDDVDRIYVTDNGNNVRIKIRNDKDLKVNYSLDKRELVISIEKEMNSSSSKETPKESKTTLPYANFKSRTIVIDAGHGDHDAGAVGPNNRYEKIVTLNIAKYLYSILKQRGHKVYLTRTKDTFIKVKNRTTLANDKNADIFISVHANSVPKSKANEIQGVETFFLSPARSERAKRVAAVENQEDVGNMSDSTKSAFLESLNRPRITASHKLAIDVQAGLLQSAHTVYKDVEDSGVREGPFWVLVGAQMPSILIEVGYISHPEESRRLYSKDYQQLLANGIANGVDAYFSKNP